MDPLQARQIRSERLVAVGRVVLAAVSLLAIWLDPFEPAKYADTTYALLAGYLACALLLLIWATLADALARDTGRLVHLFDLTVVSALLYLTEGPASPLFAYFVFLLLAAALRWHWPGVAWTALATLVIYLGLGLYAGGVLDDPAFELDRFIIRCGYLAVVALLLGYLSAYEQALRRELVKLADWPRRVPVDARLPAVLQHAANILGTERVLLVWDEAEEPWRYRASLSRGVFECQREDSITAEPPVAAGLADSDFLCLDAAAPRPPVLCAGARGVERWRGQPLTPGWQARLNCRSVIGLRLEGEGFSGRLLVLDKPAVSADDLVLGGIVARQVTADLDQFYLQQRLHQTAAAEERVRLARDLHDGVLQTLTGFALRLKVVQRLLGSDRAAARAALAELEALVAAEQRDLRFFVRQMKPSSFDHGDVNAGLVEHLRELAARVESQWGLRVELTVEPLPQQLSEALAHAVYRLLQEALANAARHGAARRVRVRIGAPDARLRLDIDDDGSGFDFRGRYDLPALTRRQIGPESIKQRVASLAGTLVITSEPIGARLEIELPLAPDTGAVAAVPPSAGLDERPRASG